MLPDAALSWLPTTAAGALALLALLAALAQPPRPAKAAWVIGILFFGAAAIAASAWQQRQELAQLGDLSSHLAELGTLLPGGVDRSPDQTVGGIATRIASLNERIKELEGQIQAQRERARTRTIDPEVARRTSEYLRNFGPRRVVVSCVPDDVEAFDYANQIVNLLRTAGWDARGPEATAIFGDAPAMGARLYARTGEPPETTKVLLDAFTRFNIPVVAGITPSDAIPDPDTVELFVSHKG